jgi:DNA-binding CsgD family transcriptional regulator
MKTKSERIMALYAKGRTTRQIAETVGCRIEYVRVVARQRKGGTSKHDEAYLMRRYGGKTLKEAHRNEMRVRLADPIRRARHMQHVRNYRARQRAANHVI